MKHLSLRAGVLLALSLPIAIAYSAGDDAALDAKAKQIHQRVLTLDSHTDVLLPSTPKQYWGKDGKSATELPKLKQGGVDALALAIAVGPGPRTPQGDAEAKAEADEKFAAIQSFIKDNAKDVGLALTAADVERIHAQGKVVVIESFLNARSLGGKLDAIDDYYKRGVRLFAFTHAGNNDFSDSSRPTGEPAVEHHGLSPLGKQAVAKLNKLGIIIDVSQITPDAVLQVVQLSKAPVIASHSDVRSLVDNTRNLSDRELDAIKKNGGVVHVVPFNTYLTKITPAIASQIRAVRVEYGLKPDYVADRAAYTEGRETLSKDKEQQFVDRVTALVPRSSVSDYVDHLDYIAKRIGIDHVGIGTDFNHGSGVTGFSNESEAPNVTRELVRRGYTEQQIAKIWSGNFLRVFRAVEATAKNQDARS